MSKEKIVKTLTDLGLKKSEAKVYLYLSKKGPKKAKEIAKAVDFTKQHLYPVLKELQNKAIITSNLDRPAKFEAISYEKLLDLFAKTKLEEAKIIQQNKMELLSDWKSISNMSDLKNYSKFSIIKGKKTIYSKIMQMIQETNKNFCFIAPLADLLKMERFGVLDHIENIPEKSKVEFRFLTDVSSQNMFATNSLFKEMFETDSSVIFRHHDLGLQLSPRMVLKDKKEALVYISKHQDPSKANDETSLFTDCPELVNSFKTVFDGLWHNSTDIRKTITQLNSSKKIKMLTFNNSESAHRKYNEILNLATKEVSILTSTQGLIDLQKSLSLLKKLSLNGVSIKIMAPITSENLEVANELSKYFEVRHVPVSYLKITIVDETHMFQSRATSKDRDFFEHQFQNFYYTNNQDYISNRRRVLRDLWKTSKPPSLVTIKTLTNYSKSSLSSRPSRLFYKTIKSIDGPIIVKEDNESKKTLSEKDIAEIYFNATRRKKESFSSGISKYFGFNGQAVIRPPNNLNLPEMLFIFLHSEQGSRFGSDNILQVFVKPKHNNHNFLPVVYISDNSKKLDFHKTTFSGCFLNDNFLLAKKGQVKIQMQGNTLFCGWNMKIPLIDDYILPPGSILLEGYGEFEPNVIKMHYPSGYALWDAYNGREAFVTYFHPYSKYSGPGTDGLIHKQYYMELYKP